MISVRVLVIEQHPLLAGMTCNALLRDPTFTVVARVHDNRDVSSMVTENDPDALVLDMGLPDKKGVALVKHLAHVKPQLPVILVGEEADGDYEKEAFQAGAAAYVTRSQVPRGLAVLVRSVLAQHEQASRVGGPAPGG